MSTVQATLVPHSIESMQMATPQYKDLGSDAGGVEDQIGSEMVKPEYSNVTLETEAPAITKGFCYKMLQDMEVKSPPYYLEGSFTGEARSDLLNQCGQKICTWAVEYRSLVEKCEECPKSCGSEASKAQIRIFVDKLCTDEPLLKAFIHVQHHKITKETSQSNKDAPSIQDSDKSEPVVTKSFCVEVLKGVEEKVAPYFINNKFTGEARKGLITECGKHICNWSAQYKLLLKEKNSCEESKSEEYLERLMHHSGEVGDLRLYVTADPRKMT